MTRADLDLPERLEARLSEDALAIFLFHGVIPRQTSAVRNANLKHLEAATFARCIERLARAGRAVTMDEALAGCRPGGSFPPRSFAVTFDDGFENNLSVAAPILADFNIPAAIYVTTGFVEHNAMSWIDRIESVVEDVSARALRVNWREEPFRLDDAQSRVAFLMAVRDRVKNDPACDADLFADALCAELGRPGRLSSDHPLDRKLTWDQVRQARDSGLFTIGGHSHTHAILSHLSPRALDAELGACHDLLRERAGVDPTHYSYPEGLAHCFSPAVSRALAERGVRCCPTAMDGVNRAGADPFGLLRVAAV
ncbi:hypothetical protein JCM15519_28020 [Fundidesulfovibrio butyratiphilus]